MLYEVITKQRPDGPVDEAANQGLKLARPRLAAEKAAGNLARGVGFFSVIHRQREEA